MKKQAFLIIAALAALAGCDWMKKKEAPSAKSEKELAAERDTAIRKSCGSEAAYERLKALVFDQAARIRNFDPRNLDPIMAGSVVRMEKPLVKSRDEKLNVTVCTGRFILDLPPGTENAFDGMRRVAAEVEYSAQPAADGSGLVYQMDGAEPIVYRLATLGMNGHPMPRIAVNEPLPAPPAAAAQAPPVPIPAPAPQPRPVPQAQPARAPAPVPPPPPGPRREPARPVVAQGASPSFNCRYAGTRTERMVCSSPSLAARDRRMASIYYEAMARADKATQAHLRRSRDAFLSRRERCGSEACVSAAYGARIDEIRSVAEGR